MPVVKMKLVIVFGCCPSWPRTRDQAHLCSSASSFVSKDSSQPIPISILTPPSSSNIDCDAGDDDCAPSRGVNVNMARWRRDQKRSPLVLLALAHHGHDGESRRGQAARFAVVTESMRSKCHKLIVKKAELDLLLRGTLKASKIPPGQP